MLKKYDLHLRNFVLLTAAGVVNAFGITLFLYPVDLFDSGISGLSMLLAQLTSETVPMAVFLVLLNIPLFIYGYRKMGMEFTIYSIYAVLVYSVTNWLIVYVLPVDVNFASPLAGEDVLLCAIFGGLLSGVGSGLTIRSGGAIDGIEVLAVMFAKKLNISVGNFVMAFNVVLYVCAGMLLQSWILPLYSILTYAVASKAVDFIIDGWDRTKSAMIVTSNPDDICNALSCEFGKGITLLRAKGYYSNTDKTMIYFVVSRFQINRLREIVREMDQEAFVTISEVSEVFGSEG